MTKTLDELYDIASNYHTDENHEMAKYYYKQVLQIDPKHYNSLRWLADNYLEQENYETAIKWFEKAKKVNDQDNNLFNDLGLCYYENCDYEKSIKNYKLGLEIKHDDETIHSNFGKALYERYLENQQEAKQDAKWWLNNFPNSNDAQVIGSAILGKNISKQNTKYVKQIFDDFAEDFDEKLSELNYKAPEYIAEIWKKYNKKPVSKILDAGCGTGLLSQHITNYCDQLYGVDLSSEMLELAKTRELYTDLFCEDLIKYLERNKDSFNGIIASDVLCYFGDLEEVFKLSYDSLHSNSYLAFSVEKNHIDEQDFLLSPSGRYVHKQKYVEYVLEKVGFKKVKIINKTLRTEHDNPVKGLITIAKK